MRSGNTKFFAIAIAATCSMLLLALALCKRLNLSPEFFTLSSYEEPPIINMTLNRNTSSAQRRFHDLYWEIMMPKAKLTSAGVHNLGYAFRGFDTFPTSKQKIYAEILQFIFETCKKVNAKCLLMSGSLLGSFRHHGMIPWDIDMDVVPQITDQETLIAALGNEIIEGKPYDLMNKYDHGYKVVSRKQNSVYCDILFAAENSTHMVDYYMAIPKHELFPMTLRPFAGYFFPAPRDSEAVLKRLYGKHMLDLCLIYMQKATVISRSQVSCSMLYPYLPFVKRRSHGDGSIEETLVIGSEEIYKILIH